jgi:hypothetical protein
VGRGCADISRPVLGSSGCHPDEVALQIGASVAVLRVLGGIAIRIEPTSQPPAFIRRPRASEIRPESSSSIDELAEPR